MLFMYVSPPPVNTYRWAMLFLYVSPPPVNTYRWAMLFMYVSPPPVNTYRWAMLFMYVSPPPVNTYRWAMLFMYVSPSPVYTLNMSTISDSIFISKRAPVLSNAYTVYTCMHGYTLHPHYYVHKDLRGNIVCKQYLKLLLFFSQCGILLYFKIPICALIKSIN